MPVFLDIHGYIHVNKRQINRLTLVPENDHGIAIQEPTRYFHIMYFVRYLLCTQSGCCLPGAHASHPITSLQALVDGQYSQAVKHQ